MQERQIRRVGGDAEIEVDVRLIAATNRALAAMVDDRHVSRGSLLPARRVHDPAATAARTRRGDLGPLVAALTRELAHKLELPAPSISRTVLARLEAHDWPGNVRELMNVSRDRDDPRPRRRARAARRILAPARSARDAPRSSAAVRVAIEDALRATRGKIYGTDGAAARLGLKPGTLQSKMRKLGIERLRFT